MIIITIIVIIMLIAGFLFGDSEKKTAWMIFLLPLSILIYVIALIIYLIINLNQ